MGNPPVAGAKFQSAGQRQQVRKLARLGGSGGTLDFVAAWFIKAGEYCSCISIGNGLTSNLEPRTSNLEPRTSNLEPRTKSEEHKSELQYLMHIEYSVFCLKKKTKTTPTSNISTK